MAGSTREVAGALAGSALVAIAKLAAAAATGSAAIFASAVQSVIEAGNQGLLLFGLEKADRPTDSPVGFGRDVYFWTFVVAVLSFGLGAGVAFSEAMHRFGDPRPIDNAGWAYTAIALALAVQGGAWLVAWRGYGEGARWPGPARRSEDPVRFAALFGGGAGLVGLVVALAGVLATDRLGRTWADGAAALVIGALMAAAAVYLATETRRLLIGEAAPSNLVEELLGLAGQAPFVDGVNEVRTMQFGPMDVLVNISVDARDRLTAGEVERGITGLEAEIKRRFPEVGRVFIEIQSAADSAAAGMPDGVVSP